MSLSCCIRGSVSAWESWWVAVEGEHCEGDEGLGAVEPGRDPGDRRPKVRNDRAPWPLVEPTPHSRRRCRRRGRLQQRCAETHTPVAILCCSAPCCAPSGFEPLDSAKPRSGLGATTSTLSKPPTHRAGERDMCGWVRRAPSCGQPTGGGDFSCIVSQGRTGTRHAG